MSKTLRAVLLLSALYTSHVYATPNFPQAMKSHLNLNYSPDCAICHLDGVTGFGTVNTPFGISMRSRGLVAYDEKSLNTALDALAGENTDSDHDGTPDIQEIIAGKSPNGTGTGTAGNPSSGTTPPLSYGCTASSPRFSSFAFMLAFCCLWRRRIGKEFSS